MCEGEVNSMEAKLLDQLSNVNSFSIKDTILFLENHDNAVITAIHNKQKVE